MKKFILVVVLVFVVSSAFAAVVSRAEEIIENFWNHGNYIKFIEDKNNISYYNKGSIALISVDEDDYTITFTGFNDIQSTTFSTKRYTVQSDKNGNIIITKN